MMSEKSFNDIFSFNLRRFLSLNNMTQLELAKKLGVGTTSVSNWCKGLKTPRMDKVDAMCEIFHCKRRDLMEEDLPSTNSSKTSNNHKVQATRIPVYGRVAAGIPIEAIENILDYEEIPSSWPGEYAGLRVKGNSMEPKISEGDVLIVRIQSDADSGDVVVALVNGEDATVKKLIKQPTGIVLQPFNPAYEPMYFTHEQARDMPVVIWGKVVENRQKF